MANTPRKMKDPTEAALSAIQDALNLRESEPAQAQETAGQSPSAAASAEGWPRPSPNRGSAEQDLFDPAAPPTAAQSATGRRAANDDRRSVGQLLQTLQERPARTPYAIASLVAILWIALGLFLAWGYLGPELRAEGLQGAAAPQLFGMAAAIIVPPMFLFVLAHMVSRAQELRMISRSMTEVALRLA